MQAVKEDSRDRPEEGPTGDGKISGSAINARRKDTQVPGL